MRSLKLTILSVIVAFIGVLPATAQFKVGPRIGVNVNELHFDESVFDSENRAGFTGGIMAEFTVPIIGVGLDASVMYVRRDARFISDIFEKKAANSHRDYIAIPVNLKYKLSLPAIQKIVAPFITTGPEFAFLTSRRAINDALKNKKTDISWNFGIGVELASHLQIAASYGLGLNKVVDFTVPGVNTVDIKGKNRYWTITAAWLF